MKEKKTIRDPFLKNQIGKLPKPTKKQTEQVKSDFKTGIRCTICGGWHHPNVIHLDYVGHAALTDRFLDVDENWNWEPMSLNESGLPRLDPEGLFWIRLTILGVTRLGVGDAGSKTGGDAMKERIGDALRNAGMRFGAALDLWHKGELHIDEPPNDLLIEKYVGDMLSIIDKSDSPGARQLWDEMTKPEQDATWKKLNTKEKAVVKKLLYIGPLAEGGQIDE